ncbi:hypothetical protein [Acidiphilium sp.]|uniref:hypothetical protein n=1 Tax=Acidiphilium sp. TaxID=527 RepID=UPI0025832B03|nr:hypothetical protein [Acidiphilium sp.]
MFKERSGSVADFGRSQGLFTKNGNRLIMNRFALLAFSAATLALSGCASIVDGTSQTLSVKTVANGQTLPGAECALKSNKGTWYVNTPGTVTVHRGYDALNVKCTHAGYSPGVLAVKSSTKGMAFGNILFGGLIGAGVDMSDGAAYNYPNLITVPMQPTPAPASTTQANTSQPTS